MDGRLGTGIATSLREAAGTDAAGLIDLLDAFNDLIREDGAGAATDSRVRFSALARLMHYFALSEHQDRHGTKGKLVPAWGSVVTRYNAFAEAVGGGLLPVLPSDDALVSFCKFETQKQGNRTERFYAGLAIFAVDLEDCGLLKRPILRTLMPVGERHLPDIIRAEISRLIHVHETGGGIRTEDQRFGESATGTVTVRFMHHARNFDRFCSYREQYAVPDDDHAHFVVYRPSRSEPDRLIKSFLAIGPARESESSSGDLERFCAFAHVYRPPNSEPGAPIRVSLGRVVPLDDGLYLIGGQREEGDGRHPFKTLKAIALQWSALERADAVLSGLVMSANLNGQHVVSRAALRATAIPHSTELSLGGISRDDLFNDLLGDLPLEIAALKRATEASPSRAELLRECFAIAAAEDDQREGHVREQARRLLRLCNNGPDRETDWDIPSGFSAVKKGKGPLTKARVALGLEEAFGSPDAAGFLRRSATSGDPEDAFDFWQSLSFGPLSHR